MVVAHKVASDSRFISRFSERLDAYDVRIVHDISPAGLNFVTLPSKVCVSSTEEDLIEAFSSNKDARSIKVVSDPVLSNRMRLLRIQGRLGFERAGKIYSLAMQ